jgi:acetoin utilization deacetylase AcuC-like enzyme
LTARSGSNFPFRKQTPHTNIPLPDGTADAEYIAVLEERLAAALASFRPNIVLYDAGVDTHAEDRLGRLSLSDDGLR